MSYGQIRKNTQYGIYGILETKMYYDKKTISVASKHEVVERKGKNILYFRGKQS